jgi:hypothetical protein
VSDGVWEPEDDAPAAADAMSAAIAAVVASVDVDATMKDAVAAAMRRRLEAVAAAAVDELLDADALTLLRASADEAAQAALQDAPGSGTYFPNVLAFVTEHLTPMYRRSLSGTDRTWCAEWWRHTEAVSRLEALWRSWEYLRLDPNLGISVWMRDHLDHHMAILLDADGPFKGCKPDQHTQRLEAFPLKPPEPANLFAMQ